MRRDCGVAAITLFALVLLLPGCGGDSDGPSGPGDTNPPAPVSDLSVVVTTATTVTLTWTAPGDDGAEGTASGYDLRYHTEGITESSWGNATRAEAVPVPRPAAEPETLTVLGLEPNTVYYFALKTADEVSNWSGLSNVAAPVILSRPGGTEKIYPTIQAAIDAAQDSDTVELPDATFTGVGNRDLDYGGKSITIRSRGGNPEMCIIDCRGSVSEPHRAFHFHSGEGPSSVLEGVTVTNGHVGGEWPDGYGGAVLCVQYSSPTLANCVFSGCASEQDGGAMYCQYSSPTLTDCTISNNSARNSGGIGCDLSSSPTIANCVFSRNRTTIGGGGAMVISFSSHPTISSCTFSRNSAANGGAIVSNHESCPTLGNCIFSHNSARRDGGSFACAMSSSPAFSGCTFFGNSAADHGGAMSCYNESSPTLLDCTFSSNRADTSGAVHCRRCSSPASENTIIAFSTEGQAIGCDHSEGQCNPVLTCCDVFGNAGGDWVGCIAGQFGTNGNISEDPLFCDPDNGDFHLQPGSPCTANGQCGFIGAWEAGCPKR